MASKEFEITFRREDILYIYRNDLRYKLFKPENKTRLAFGFLCLCLIIACIVLQLGKKDFYFMICIFIAGLFYNIIMLLSDYWKENKKSNEIKTWIDSIQKYRSHRIVLLESSFRYDRDNESFFYEINQTERLYHNSDYFYCKTLGGEDLMLPRNAFKANEYEEFTRAVNEMKR